MTKTACQAENPGMRPSRFTVFRRRTVRDFRINKGLYLLVLPVLIYYALFCYAPMYGAQIAFKNYMPALGITKSPWVGFQNFQDFFEGVYFWRLLGNTLRISLSYMVIGFPIPILLALLLNELRSGIFQRIAQSILYLPHFISLVVICAIVTDFTLDKGVVNIVLNRLFGWQPVSMLIKPEYFTAIYIISGIWQESGWGSIIYLAAITAVDQELYEAARIDGAGRLKQTLHITIPTIAPTIVIMLILRAGRIMSVGSEKIILLYNPAIYETADVISSYVYRQGLQDMKFSFSSAVGLFNSAVNFILLVSVNKVSKMVQGTSLW